MGLLSHKIGRSEIAAGGHIYTWRTVFAYAHHGIYVGSNKVVHFTPEENMDSTEFPSLNSAPKSRSSLDLPESCSKTSQVCTNIPDCGFRKSQSGVVLSCLECFEYGTHSSIFLTKLRGGTCTIAKSNPPEAVIHRVMYLLQNGFGNYDLFKRNCEDFALYCKLGLVIQAQGGLGSSGQACGVISAPLAAILSSPLKLFTSSLVGMSLVTTGMYCFSRYATDIGVRADVVKVEAEDLVLLHGCEGQIREVTNGECPKREPNCNRFNPQSLHVTTKDERELNHDLIDAPTLKRRRCS